MKHARKYPVYFILRCNSCHRIWKDVEFDGFCRYCGSTRVFQRGPDRQNTSWQVNRLPRNFGKVRKKGFPATHADINME